MKSLKEDATVESLKTVLRPDRENIFIPTSGSNVTLIKILPQLTYWFVRIRKVTSICSVIRMANLHQGSFGNIL